MNEDSAPSAMQPGGSPSVLIVEHDSALAAPISEQLLADGYATALAHSAQHARALALISPPALAILGRLDSPRAALDLLAEVRGGNGESPWPEDLPVIVLGSSARSPELLRAFAAGADDFLARPPETGGGRNGDDEGGLDYLELRARMQALLRRAARSPGGQATRLGVGPLRLDTRSRSVYLYERPIELRPREYALLLHLAREPTRVFTRSELLGAVWGEHVSSRTRTLDSHASRLRSKLAGRSEDRWILNVRGVGYRLTT